MANEEHLEIFKQGVEAWNRRRLEEDSLPPDLSRGGLSTFGKRGKFPKIHLTYANLTEARLFGADLSGADLSYADLSWSDLDTANLTGANLKGANLTNARFVFATLKNTNLTKANLTGTNLHHANLEKANFKETVLAGVILADVILSGAKTFLPASISNRLANLTTLKGLATAIFAGLRAVGNILLLTHYPYSTRR